MLALLLSIITLDSPDPQIRIIQISKMQIDNNIKLCSFSRHIKFNERYNYFNTIPFSVGSARGERLP